MGLLDMLQGMTNAPGGQQGGRGGMSPLTMGLLALLAYKTMKGEGPLGNLLGQRTPSGAGTPTPGASGGGGLLNWLQTGLGGASASGTAGTLINGGLTELLRRFEQSGQGGVAHSWVGNSPNQPISPGDIERAAGADTLDELAEHAGVPRDQLLQRLSAELPQAVDQLTPQGRVPTKQEAASLSV